MIEKEKQDIYVVASLEILPILYGGRTNTIITQ